MTIEERLKYCRTCKNRKRDMNKGLICSLTDNTANFENICEDYLIDEKTAEKEKLKELSKGNIEKGKKKAIVVFSFLISLSVSMIMISHFTFKPLSENEIIKEVLRIGFEIGLFFAIFNGKNWAKVILTILILLGIILSIAPMITLINESSLGWLMIILIAIYGYTLYFINGDKDFLEFFKYQQKNRISLKNQE